MRDLWTEFEKFDKDNPVIWELIQRFCKSVLDAGQTKWSISGIFERIRWEIYVVTKSKDDWKINNNHRAYYARKWLAEHPEYPKFFEIRRVRGSNGHSFGEDGQGNLFV
jgi:hypothetical protein